MKIVSNLLFVALVLFLGLIYLTSSKPVGTKILLGNEFAQVIGKSIASGGAGKGITAAIDVTVRTTSGRVIASRLKPNSDYIQNDEVCLIKYGYSESTHFYYELTRFIECET